MRSCLLCSILERCVETHLNDVKLVLSNTWSIAIRFLLCSQSFLLLGQLVHLHPLMLGSCLMHLLVVATWQQWQTASLKYAARAASASNHTTTHMYNTSRETVPPAVVTLLGAGFFACEIKISPVISVKPFGVETSMKSVHAVDTRTGD